MNFRVRLTGQAKQDLRDIYEYIAFKLLEPEIAKKLTYRIADKLETLGKTHGSYPAYQEEPWKSRGLRRINIGNYSGFYLVAEKEVQVIRILYGGRDISTILQESV
ncbi:MAG: type II toxin-antitoxin system RelE/ParE family toxin [Oscillospiraceae bacterium]|jgi:toxin ParE1/3/4|nr:type II toxin-antitoxin system RelE/ParE family toxin [Oscillospiraceae bacterium]